MMRLQSCVLLLLALAPLSAADCNVYRCKTCEVGNANRCSVCHDSFTLVDRDDPHHFGHWNSCEYGIHTNCGVLTTDEEEAYYAKILVGSIVGAVICLATVIVASLPVCCGKFTTLPLIPVSVVCMVIAGICMAIPLLTGKVAMDGVIEDACAKCGCTEADKNDLKEGLSALGVAVAYTFGCGFVVVILGAVTMCLGCCMCCPCCGPLKTAKDDAAAAPPTVTGQVVGTQA